MSEKLRRMVSQFSVVVVAGARQVGKSTLLRHVLPEWPAVVFDPALDVGNARADPDLFLDNHPAPLVLDEIQYAPELVAAIKRRVDRDRRPGSYVLTGSQQWTVMRAMSESLAGRVVFLDLEGFSLAEIAGTATADHWLGRYLDDPDAFVRDPPPRLPATRPVFAQLWRGFLPEPDALADEWLPEFHRAYLRTCVEKDVRRLGEVGDWQDFGRFTALLAATTGREVNRAQLGREIGMHPQTAARWLAALQATFLWFEVPAFHGNAIKRLSGRPRGFLADTGLACALQAISSPRALAGHPLLGGLFETAVVAELRKLSASMATPPVLYHWRSHGGAEVDVVLERDGRLHPVEIKLSTRPGRSDARGIAAFRDTYPARAIAPGLVLAPVAASERLAEHVWALPWDSR